MSLTNSTLPSFIAKRKRSVKIPIPVEEHPTYNFIGLIIGPRGKTQKEMENKTGCKIAIRGKGSIKEGARGRLNNQATPQEGADEPLHVVVTGDDPVQIEIAAEMIRSMLVVIDDEVNVHKQNQLRELALLNGTLKDNEEWCTTCGEKGHREFECPKRFSLGNKAAGNNMVKCAICGETSHPTRDCKRLGEETEKKEQLDEDYSAFMAELDGKPVEKKGDAAAPVSAVSAAAVPSLGGDSVLTILQPARVVKSDGTVGDLVSTISSTVPTSDVTTGVTTISSTVPGVAASSGITTISSTIPTAIPYTLPGVTTISSTVPGASVPGIALNGLPLPPPPPPNGVVALPPPPVGLPPQGSAIPIPTANGFVPPPPPPPAGIVQQYPQQGYAYPYQQPGYPAQPYGQPQQMQQWGAPNANAGAWNPNAYYDPTGGAGGLNWWDQSEE
jgi:splicing factor 1